MTAARRQFIEQRVNPARARIVEIGALDAPTYAPDRFDIRFIDYATKAQLVAENPGNARFAPEKLVEIDYVIGSPEYSRHIAERFDLAIANHVIEHIPDTIRWLDELRAILDRDGHLFLAVPDRRYTFDYLRPETTIADVLRAYRQEMKRPDFAMLFEHNYYYRDLKAAHAWNGELDEKIKAPRQTITAAFRSAEELSRRAYASVHCHVYTHDSFMRLFGELRKLSLVGFEIVASQDVQPKANEFHLLLRRV